MESLALPVDPVVRSLQIELSPPSLENPRADIDTLLGAVEGQTGLADLCGDLEVIREVPCVLRSQDWKVGVCLRGSRLVRVASGSSRPLGLAVDLGTTKVAGYLVDLESGRNLASLGTVNPQVSMGEDIIARMARAKDSPADAARLQELVVGALNRLAGDLSAEVRADPRDVVEVVVAGNTAMHHLLLKLPVEQLAMSPYVPALRESFEVRAREIGLGIAPGAYVHLLPNIGGFVGGDHVAFLLATRLDRTDGVALALDIGTNTEVCLAVDGALTSLSCASGPAFEGSHIRHGMSASHGAIEHVRVEDGNVEYETVGGAVPVGICGAGLLEVAAQLLSAGVLDRKGRLGDHPRVRLRDGEQEFVIAETDGSAGMPAVTITQRDIQQLQLAKGAIRAGIRVLLEASGRTEEEISQVVIAGGFGTYLDVGSAVAIGMLPSIPLERYRQVGNAAGVGASMALVSRAARAEARRIAGSVRHIELATAPRFMQVFAQSMFLG